MRDRLLLPFLYCSIFFLFFLQSCKSEDFVSHVSNGNEVPSFAVTTIDGSSFDIDALKGKVVLLNFWATWCAPCQVEMPRLENEIWAKYKGLGFEMVAIARKQTNQEITAFRKSSHYSFPMASDPDGKIYYKFANAGIPRNYLIGPDGKVICQTLGYSPDDFNKLTSIIAKELGKIRSRAQIYGSKHR